MIIAFIKSPHHKGWREYKKLNNENLDGYINKAYEIKVFRGYTYLYYNDCTIKYVKSLLED